MTQAGTLTQEQLQSFNRLGLKLQEQRARPDQDAMNRSFEKIGVPLGITDESITAFINRFPTFTAGESRANVARMVEQERIRIGGVIEPFQETEAQAVRRNVVGFVRGFERAAFDVPVEMTFNAYAAMADFFENPEFADAARAEADRVERQARRRAGVAFDRGIASDAGEFFGMIAPSAAFLAFGGVASVPLFAYFGLQAFGGGTREYRKLMLEKGVEPNAIDQFAVGMGFAVAEVVAEKLGLTVIGGKLTKEVMQSLGNAVLEGSTRKAAIILTGLTVAGTVNSVEEMLTQVGQNAAISNISFFEDLRSNVIGTGVADPDRPLTRGVGQAGLIGLAGGGVLGGASFTGSFLRSGIPIPMESGITEEEFDIAQEALDALNPTREKGQQRVDTIMRKDPRNIRPGDGDGFVFTTTEEVIDVSTEALIEAVADESRSEEDRQIAAAILEDLQQAKPVEEAVVQRADEAADRGEIAVVEEVTEQLGPKEATRAQITEQQKVDFLVRLGLKPGVRGPVPITRGKAGAAVRIQQAETRQQQREAVAVERRLGRDELKRRLDAVEARLKSKDLEAAGARTAIRQIVNQNVEPRLRGRFNRVIADAKTIKDVAGIIPRIRKTVAETRRREAQGRFAKAANRLRRRRGLTTDVGTVVRGVFGTKKPNADTVKQAAGKLSTPSLEVRADQLEQAVRDQRQAEQGAKRTRKELIEEMSGLIALEIMATEQPRRFVDETTELEPRTTLNQIIPNLGVADMTTLSTLTDLMGGRENSLTQEFLYQQLNQGQRSQNRFMWEIVDQFNDLIEGVSEVELAAMSDTLSSVPGLLARGQATVQREPIRASTASTIPMQISGGQTVRITAAEKMGLLATVRDPATRKQIVAGRLVTFETLGTETITLTEEDLRVIEGSATETERLIVDAVVGLINGPLRDRFAEVSEATTGQNLTSETTHYPRHAVITDEAARRQVDAMTFDTTALTRQADIQNADITKEREAGTTTTLQIRDIFGEFNNFVWVMTNVTELAPAATMASQILNSVAVQDVFKRTKRGKAINRRINEQYNRMARDVVGGAPITFGETLLRLGIRAVQVKALGFNVPVMAYQHASLFNAAAVPGMSMTAIASAEIEGAALDSTYDEQITEFSPTLRTRRVGGSFGIVQEGPARRAILGREQLGLLDIPMLGIRGVDAITIRVIWRAAQIQLGESGPTDQTALLAEEIINQSQPTTNSLHTTGLGIQARNSAGVAMLVMFRGQTAKTLDQMVRATVLHSRGRISSAERNKVYILALVAPAIMLTIIGTPGLSGLILKGFPGDEDELEDRLTDAAFGFLRRLTGVVPVLGTAMVDLLEAMIRGSSFSSTTAPVTAIATDIVKAFTSVRAAINRGDALDTAKAISRVLEATPPFPAFPFRAFRQGVLDRLDDDEPVGKRRKSKR